MWLSFLLIFIKILKLTSSIQIQFYSETASKTASCNQLFPHTKRKNRCSIWALLNALYESVNGFMTDWKRKNHFTAIRKSLTGNVLERWFIMKNTLIQMSFFVLVLQVWAKIVTKKHWAFLTRCFVASDCFFETGLFGRYKGLVQARRFLASATHHDSWQYTLIVSI